MTHPPASAALPPTHRPPPDRRPAVARTVVAVAVGLLAALLLSLASLLAVVAVVVADADRPGRLLVVLVEVPAARSALADSLANDIEEEAREAPGAPTVHSVDLRERVEEVLASDDLRTALLDLRVEDGEVDLDPVRDVVADAIASSDDPDLDRAAERLRDDEDALDARDLGRSLDGARLLVSVLAVVAGAVGLLLLGLTALAAPRTSLGVVGTLGASCAATLLALHPVEALVPDDGALRHLADAARSVGTLADPATSVVLGLGLAACVAVAARTLARHHR